MRTSTGQQAWPSGWAWRMLASQGGWCDCSVAWRTSRVSCIIASQQLHIFTLSCSLYGRLHSEHILSFSLTESGWSSATGVRTWGDGSAG